MNEKPTHLTYDEKQKLVGENTDIVRAFENGFATVDDLKRLQEIAKIFAETLSQETQPLRQTDKTNN